MPTLVAITLATMLAGPLAAQSDSVWQPIATEGVFRASAAVDSVYVDRLIPAATVMGGDFTAYLLARLGARQLPPDFGYRVAVDSTLLRIGGTIAQLPSEARQALGLLVMFLSPDTRLEGEVELAPAGPQAVRFHLRTATINGVPIPETILIPVLQDIGRQYPALTRTGRDLYVQVPAGAGMKLLPGGVALTAP